MDEFKAEMLTFKNLFTKYLPKNIMWLQEGFTTEISLETHLWTEEVINKYCLSKGLQKVAFVVGSDIITHLGLIDFFEETSIITPKHFANKEEALHWILDIKSDYPSPVDPNSLEISYLGVTKQGKSQFIIETDTKNTESTLRSFKHIISENAFLKTNAARFFSLTPREKEVFQLYANGTSFKEISDELFLSEFTIRTHWRNAKKKLEIKSLSDISDYKNSFLR